MAGRCETCKWWKDNGNALAGKCGLFSTYRGQFVVTSQDVPLRKAQVILDPNPPDTGRFIYWNTAYDFGCVQHEPKDG